MVVTVIYHSDMKDSQHSVDVGGGFCHRSLGGDKDGRFIPGVHSQGR